MNCSFIELRTQYFFYHAPPAPLLLACLQIPVLKKETNKLNKKPRPAPMSGDNGKVLFQLSSLQEFCIGLFWLPRPSRIPKAALRGSHVLREECFR